jgi:hypothetical protein
MRRPPACDALDRSSHERSASNADTIQDVMARKNRNVGTNPRIPMTRVFREVGEFFESRSPVHRAAAALADRLDALGIPFAVTGGLALGGHGYVRATDDIDIVVREEGWRRFKDRHVGLGYTEAFHGSKAVRDTENGVRIDVLYTGGFPGDGRPKPVAFPDPADRAVIAATKPWPVVTLETLIELKIASGMTALGRQLRDFADVVELIRANALPESFAESLDPYVRADFLRLHRMAVMSPDPPSS